MRRSAAGLLLCLLAFSAFAEAALPRGRAGSRHVATKKTLDEPQSSQVEPDARTAHEETTKTTSELIEETYILAIVIVIFLSCFCVCLIVACCIGWSQRSRFGISSRRSKRGG